MKGIAPQLQKPSTQLSILLATAGTGILILLWPAVSSHPVRPGISHTQNTTYNLKRSISAFFTEYSAYPLKTVKADLSTMSGHPFITILLGFEDPATFHHNPRKIAFYTGMKARKKNGRRIKGIQYDENGPSYLWDEWGNLYHIRFDTDHDNQIRNPEFPEQLLPETIAVWSAGPDGDFSTWDDNIKTW